MRARTASARPPPQRRQSRPRTPLGTSAGRPLPPRRTQALPASRPHPTWRGRERRRTPRPGTRGQQSRRQSGAVPAEACPPPPPWCGSTHAPRRRWAGLSHSQASAAARQTWVPRPGLSRRSRERQPRRCRGHAQPTLRSRTCTRLSRRRAAAARKTLAASAAALRRRIWTTTTTTPWGLPTPGETTALGASRTARTGAGAVEGGLAGQPTPRLLRRRRSARAATRPSARSQARWLPLHRLRPPAAEAGQLVAADEQLSLPSPAGITPAPVARAAARGGSRMRSSQATAPSTTRMAGRTQAPRTLVTVPGTPRRASLGAAAAGSGRWTQPTAARPTRTETWSALRGATGAGATGGSRRTESWCQAVSADPAALAAAAAAASSSPWRRLSTSIRGGTLVDTGQAGQRAATGATAADGAAPPRAGNTVRAPRVRSGKSRRSARLRPRGAAAQPTIPQRSRCALVRPTAVSRLQRRPRARRERCRSRGLATRQGCQRRRPPRSGAACWAGPAAQLPTRLCPPARWTCPLHPSPRWGLRPPVGRPGRLLQGFGRRTCLLPQARVAGFASAKLRAERYRRPRVS